MPRALQVITVTLNTALDRVLEVPGFKVGGHQRGRRLRRYVGGKGINVSHALSRMGRGSVATGFVGRGQVDLFEQSLQSAEPGRINCQLLNVDGATRENITIIDPESRTDTHIREAGFELTRNDVARIKSKSALLARESSVMVFAGSLPPGMEPKDLAALASEASDAGARVVIDVGGDLLKYIYSSWAAHHDAAEAEANDPREPPVWMIKPNRDELAQMLDREEGDTLRDEDIPQAAQPLTRYAKWVLVTLGAQGAWLISRDGCWRGRVDLSGQTVVNTVGCGDCMLAGVLEGLCAGAGPERMLRIGLGAATANALNTGVAKFDRSAVDQHAESAEIHAGHDVSSSDLNVC